MNEAIQNMLEKYSIKDSMEAENVLKEIIQKIALLGLHRSNFFEKAAFYGGTALRILYGLPRYSEDLDFTLFKTEKSFSLKPYFSAVEKELEAYGFKVEIEPIEKPIPSKVESAFIKAHTKIHLLKIEGFKIYGEKMQSSSKLQIKFEVDTDLNLNLKLDTYLIQQAFQ
ncbi:MAG: nucleotidyl transferase AbiEii/AbiGii toxin family protein [Bdellovibrionales bacterium]|nr:nucleotidyl transferase AbiEii/AbiGii toxin family protein [Bdellovibrionales bacterium]